MIFYRLFYRQSWHSESHCYVYTLNSKECSSRLLNVSHQRNPKISLQIFCWSAKQRYHNVQQGFVSTLRCWPWAGMSIMHLHIMQGRWNGFQSGGTMGQWKVLSAAIIDPKENFLNFKRSRIAKISSFWRWYQSFTSFCFESLSFFPFISATLPPSTPVSSTLSWQIYLFDLMWLKLSRSHFKRFWHNKTFIQVLS